MNKIHKFISMYIFYKPVFTMSFHEFLIELSFNRFKMYTLKEEGNQKYFRIFYSNTSKSIKKFTKKLCRKNYFSDMKWYSSSCITDTLRSLIKDFSYDNFKSLEIDRKKLEKLQNQIFKLVILINQKVEDA